MSETLTQFGTSFQSKIITSLITDVKFIQTISDILSSSMFDSDSNKWLVKDVSLEVNKGKIVHSITSLNFGIVNSCNSTRSLRKICK